MRTLQDYIAHTQRCETEDELFGLFDAYILTFGFNLSVYRLIAQHLRSVPAETSLIRDTFPADWRQLYQAKGYGTMDPVLEQVRVEARPFYWSDIAIKRNLDARHRQYFADLRAFDLPDGLAVPVFGPMGTIAYFGLSHLNPPLELTMLDKLELQFACMQTHLHYFELNPSVAPKLNKPLSPRERDVLNLVAAGHSNTHISAELGITENTVDTLLRRVFAKLEVNNRLSAALKGISSAQIQP